MSTSRTRSAIPALCLITLAAAAASAQDIRARVQGLVSDTSGGVLPGRDRRPHERRHGRAATRTTNTDGRYLFDYVDPGPTP